MPEPGPAEDLWTAPLDRWLSELDASPAGLTGEEAAQRLDRYGPNDAMARRRRPLLLQFLGRFGNPLVLVLLFASTLSAITGNLTSFVIITVIVLLSVVLDFVQEVRAQNAVEALRRSVALQADVRRDGAQAVVPVDRLVPGDVVHLSAGDIVPADGRLLESRDLFVNQALLTGEPYPAEKQADDTAASAVFMGTSVISGTAVMLVCRTAARTALGGLAGTLATQRAPDAFEVGVRQFGLLILRLTVFLVLFVLVANVLFHRPWLESLLFALALAVGLTPELLPMVVTVTLAGGAKRLAARRVIVKRLAAIHDLGAMDVLCTDKTGTLTEARIKVVRHIDARGATSDRVLELAYLNSFFESGIKSPLDDAILDRGKREVGQWHKLDEVPFDFERRRVSVLLEQGGSRLLVVKGAPEDVLRLSTSVETEPGSAEAMERAARQRLLGLFEQLGEEGFRVLAIAWREVGPDHPTAAVTDEVELVFAGFVAFLDPPKASAAAAIATLAASGVTVKILTGDNERVTRHVCGELGCPDRRRADRGGAVGAQRRGPAGAPAIGQPVLPGHAAAEAARAPGAQAAQARHRVSGRRDQRCVRATCGRCRDLGRRCRRRCQGGGRSGPARARSGRGPRRSARGPTHSRERNQIHHDGQQLQLRQHVQHGRGCPVPAVPADAADPGPAQQPALRLLGDRRAAGPCRLGGTGEAEPLEPAADRALHAGPGPGQLAVRLLDLRAPCSTCSPQTRPCSRLDGSSNRWQPRPW